MSSRRQWNIPLGGRYKQVSLYIVYVTVLGESILCSNCNYRTDDDPEVCTVKPPTPYPCFSPPGYPARCITIREYDGQGKMTSSNGNIFRVTGPLCGEFTGHRWIPLTKASDVELRCILWSAPWINSWANYHEAGDLRHHRAPNDIIVTD